MNTKSLVAFGSGRYVPQTKPLAPYIGGKRLLARRIDDVLATMDHDAYCEPFVGMGGVFFRRSAPKNIEIINDINRDIATLYRVVQRHETALRDLLRFHVSCRAEFEDLLRIDPTQLADLERAMRFLVLQRGAFGGLATGRSFGVSPNRARPLNPPCLEGMIRQVHERLAGVVVECLPWQSVILRYDHRGMLFYLDPPYWGCEATYGPGIFAREDFQELADVLQRLKGQFLLSINDVPQIREIFAWADIRAVRTSYSVSAHSGRTTVSELLIQRA